MAFLYIDLLWGDAVIYDAWVGVFMRSGNVEIK